MSMDSIWRFKNFQMGNELETAGEFVYESARRAMAIRHFFNEFEINSILYNGAVGIERLQKILYCLYAVKSEDNLKNPEKCLMGHNHLELHDKIQELVDCGFSKKHICVLGVFQDYYRDYRYGNYVIGEKRNASDLMIRIFKKCDNKTNFSALMTRFEQKKYIKFYINALGEIARKYYRLIANKAYELNMYTYELDTLSAATRVFWTSDGKKLYDELTIEGLSVKEFLIFLKKEDSGKDVFKLFDDIKPLEYDTAMANDFLCELVNGNVDDSLIGSTEAMYEDMDPESMKERTKLVDLIGDRDLTFEDEE